LSALLLEHEGLVQDTRATLREVAGILYDLWDLQEFAEPGDFGAHGFLSHEASAGTRAGLLADASKELGIIRDGVTALRDLVPCAVVEAEEARGLGSSAGGPSRQSLGRAMDLLADLQERVDRLSLEMEFPRPNLD
jgi:hypothetical protein